MNMVKILKIYEHGKTPEGEVWGTFGPCPLTYLWWVLDTSLGRFKVEKNGQKRGWKRQNHEILRWF